MTDLDRLVAALHSNAASIRRIADEQKTLAETFPKIVTTVHYSMEAEAQIIERDAESIEALRELMRRHDV